MGSCDDGKGQIGGKTNHDDGVKRNDAIQKKPLHTGAMHGLLDKRPRISFPTRRAGLVSACFAAEKTRIPYFL